MRIEGNVNCLCKDLCAYLSEMVTRSSSSSLYRSSSSSFGSSAPRKTRCIISTNSSYLKTKFRKRSTVFILREVVIVDRDPSDVLAKGGLDDQLARQIKLVEAPLHLGTKSYLCKSLNIMFWNSKYQLSCYSSSVDIY